MPVCVCVYVSVFVASIFQFPNTFMEIPRLFFFISSVAVLYNFVYSNRTSNLISLLFDCVVAYSFVPFNALEGS